MKYINTDPSQPRTNFQADVLGNGQSVNAERCVRLRKNIDETLPKAPYGRGACRASFGVWSDSARRISPEGGVFSLPCVFFRKLLLAAAAAAATAADDDCCAHTHVVETNYILEFI